MSSETMIAEPVTGVLVEDREALPGPAEAVAQMRRAIIEGQHWFPALLDAVGRWRVPEEVHNERHYQYLISGEAFDWLLLAERLLEAADDLVPAPERDALLFEGQWPEGFEDDEFERRLGAAKFTAHLNYLYGVLVEDALQLHVEEEIHKENRARAIGQDHRVDETTYERIYMTSRRELAAMYYEETGDMLRDAVSLAEWKAFTYWLFKLRLRRQDKARVASDTRKGLAQLSRMELAVRQRRRGAALTERDFADRFVDA